MSVIGDVLAGLRKTLLLQDNVTRLEQEVRTLSIDQGRMRDYVESIDRRLARLEGFVEGAAATSRAPRLPRG